jgi:hypothetical protein
MRTPRAFDTSSCLAIFLALGFYHPRLCLSVLPVSLVYCDSTNLLLFNSKQEPLRLDYFLRRGWICQPTPPSNKNNSRGLKCARRITKNSAKDKTADSTKKTIDCRHLHKNTSSHKLTLSNLACGSSCYTDTQPKAEIINSRGTQYDVNDTRSIQPINPKPCITI